MGHKYDYECRCTECVSFELALRRILKEDDQKRREAKLTCTVTVQPK